MSMETVRVAAGRPYPVHIGSGLLARAGALTRELRAPCRVALVMDQNVAAVYGDAVARSYADAGFRVVEFAFPPGESSKSIEQLSSLLEFLANHELSRSDCIVALGGGVTGDLAGFAAAVYLRGIAYIQLPTTLLAAVDSSVGGKTAINLGAGKNLAGAFWQPEQVICDCDTFATLPRPECASGAAECLKYGVLDDVALFERLAGEGLSVRWQDIVATCVRQKAYVVEQDERENGVRQLLNLGHTFGHAAERLSGYTLRHGEGVALGMLIVARAAEKRGIAAPGTAAQIESALRALELPITCPYQPEDLAREALSDKKRRDGEITLVLPTRIGMCTLHRMPTAELLEVATQGMEV